MGGSQPTRETSCLCSSCLLFPPLPGQAQVAEEEEGASPKEGKLQDPPRTQSPRSKRASRDRVSAQMLKYSTAGSSVLQQRPQRRGWGSLQAPCSCHSCPHPGGGPPTSSLPRSPYQGSPCMVATPPAGLPAAPYLPAHPALTLLLPTAASALSFPTS